MTLVERFIDMGDWPTSRKSALAGVSIVGPLLGIVALVWLSDPVWLDVSTAVRLLLCGVAINAVFTAVSWLMYRRGHDGRWTTGYVFLGSYNLWVVVFVVVLGGIGTPLIVAPLVLPLINAIWYDTRMGVVSLVSISTFLVTAAVLDLTDVVAFGPAMKWPDTGNVSGSVALLVLLSIFAVWTYGVGFVAVAAADLQHRRLALAHGLIRRYVPEQVADAVLSGTPEAIERHERRKLTVFFSDLVGFTDLSEELEPEDLATVLHDYFTEMSAIAKRHGGTVDDLVGDAILVLFGAPDRTDDHDQALRAVRMSVDMQAAMGPLNQRWEAAGIPETLAVRMGINTGVVTVGNFGSAERTKYTALGKQVNIAARIQSQCEPGKVLLSHATWLLIRDQVTCVPKGELTLKGLHKPMPAYEVQA
jgi:class 3 adenylate cyclase